MRKNTIDSGINIIGDVPWGTHFCQFYRTREDLMDILIPYLKAGLENNEFCIWITSQPLEVEKAKEALRQSVPDFDIYLEKGQIEIIPHSHWCMKEGVLDSEQSINKWFEKLSRVLDSGYDGLRLTEDISWLKKGNLNDFISFEEKLDSILGNNSIVALYNYSLDRCSPAEIIKVAINHQLALIKDNGKWELIENSVWKNITGYEQNDKALYRSEQSFRFKAENNLCHAQDLANPELAEIVDVQAIQSLMNDFYNFAHTAMALVDLKGNILVSVGWQEICTKYHRIHPETCKHCIESDTKLSLGVVPGELNLYKCKNNMWDIATPLMVSGKHVGNIFSGQFFFEDAPVDYELFRSQARKYGFSEEEYIAALEKVPRLSKEVVDTSMVFFTTLANMLSQLSYSNFKLTQSLAERNSLVDALRESEEKYRNIVETANEGIWIIDNEYRTIYVNEKTTEMLGYSQEELIGRSVWDFTDENNKVVSILNMNQKQQDTDENHEFKFICKNGSPLWTLVNTKSFFDKDGKFAGSMGMLTDITKRKQEEHRIRRYNHILEGINWIFSNVVQAKTEEELGNVCLSVALKVTDSQFGFINEMGADGLLHDVAKSELAWEQCLMYDKTGHRRSLSDFAVHGLYGSVIINEKGFFTNDPQLHTDSIGLPYGHPPITSFLGVPLVQDGKTMGLIAVANHEGGYSYEQQEDLEAIAPAVMQALQRKRSEEALRLSNIYNRSLIEASLDPLVTIERDGKITDVNGAAEKVTGYSRNSLIETDFSDYFTEPEKARTGYQQVFKEGEIRDYPLEIQHKNGHITPVLYNASVYRDENGKVIGAFAAARDITERKKAEEALKRAHESLEEKVKERTIELEKAYNSLKESEKRLAAAQRMAHLGTWDLDPVTGEVYWSDEMYRIYGLNPQESGATYDELLNYVHPEDREYVDNVIKKTLNGEPSGIDYRIVLGNGEERNVHAESEAIFDENNIPIWAKGIIQDVTERKRAEEKLQTLANAVESSNDAIVTLSLEGIVASWNKAAEQVYGYSAKEILGKDVSILEPDNIKGEIKQFSEKIKQGKKIHQYESIRLKKDGTTIYISVTLSPIFDITGKLVAISAIVRDVTERIKAEEALRESEARLRQFYESDMIGVFYFNLDGLITDANDKLLEIVGYTREDLQAGTVNWNKMTPSECHSLEERYIAKLRTAGIKEPQQKEYIRKDGSRVPVMVGVASFNQACNEGIAFVLDVTEKKKAEEALANLEVTRKKEIHHRIKNNLQVISSLLDLQAEKFDNPKVIEAFRESQNRVISMALIHEELYKGEKTDTLNFSEYLKKLAETLFHTYSLSSKNIHLNMDLEENALFDMDIAVPLGIIVNELVSNSLKHAFPARDRGEIQIELHRDEYGEHKKKGNKGISFILTISDNGVGIPENLGIEDLDSLGIQLIVTLVDQLDGELELKRNNGTEFAIRFTVKEENDQTLGPFVIN